MEIAFRKNDPSFIGKAICWWTKSPHSHCEMVFTNGLTFSAFIDGYKTEFRHIDHSPDEWDFINIPISREDEYKIYEWCLNEDNCLYDMIGIIFTQVIPISFENPWWWFCSEVCTAGVQQVNILTESIPHEVNPGKLYKLLNERFNQ